MITTGQMDALDKHLVWCREQIDVLNHALKMYEESLNEKMIAKTKADIHELETFVQAFKPASFQTQVH